MGTVRLSLNFYILNMMFNKNLSAPFDDIFNQQVELYNHTIQEKNNQVGSLEQQDQSVRNWSSRV